MKLTFLGGVGSVTGSKYLIEAQGKRLLVDCGLYQGVKNLRVKNWQKFPMDVSKLDAVLLTHAHIDHSGYIPALVKHGYRGPVFCTKSTYELCRVLLPDAGFLQEEDARYANRKKFSKHSPAEPLYTEAEAIASLKQFKTIRMNHEFEVVKDIWASYRPAGHILGAASIRLHTPDKSIVFSGDVGRPNDLMMYPPEPLPEADYLVTESTYGNRLHKAEDCFQFFADIINKTVERGGIVLIPSFAVGRAQVILFIIEQLLSSGRIPKVPVFLNSPMAITATEIHAEHHFEHKLTKEDCTRIDAMTRYVRTAEESIELNSQKFPSIIISASGMASGGRVLHHLKTLVSNHKNSVIFAGFQAPGTRGDALINGAQTIKVHGEYRPVQADIYHLDSLSAHADYQEMLDWLKASDIRPRRVFVTHGESVAADSFRIKLADEFGWNAVVPEMGEAFVL